MKLSLKKSLKTAYLKPIRTFAILCFRYNSLSTLKVNNLAGLKKLELLMLHSNTIKTVEDGSFHDLTSLQVKHEMYYFESNIRKIKVSVIMACYSSFLNERTNE